MTLFLPLYVLCGIVVLHHFTSAARRPNVEKVVLIQGHVDILRYLPPAKVRPTRQLIEYRGHKKNIQEGWGPLRSSPLHRPKRETDSNRKAYVFPKYSKEDVALVLGTILGIIVFFLIGFIVITYFVYQNEKRDGEEECDGMAPDLHRAQPYPDRTVFLVKHVETGPGKFLKVRFYPKIRR